MQSAAIAEAKDAYLADGWNDVIVLDVGEYFPSYEYVETAKEDGGKVYVVIAHSGEVTFYEGQLSRKDIRARERAASKGEDPASDRPELTKAMQAYLDLHRHTAVRCDLLTQPGMALRLAVAQMIAGSELWSIQADPQKTPSDAIAASVQDNTAQAAFEAKRAEIAALLGVEAPDSITPRTGDWGVLRDLHALFAKLMTLSDDEVQRVLTYVVAETLTVGSPMVEALGVRLGTDLSQHWSPDETFFDLLRDKQAINAMLREIGGKAAADGNVTATAKAQKDIIKAFMDGTRTGGKPDWHPRYAAFPMRSYTKRGGLSAIDNWTAVKSHHA